MKKAVLKTLYFLIWPFVFIYAPMRVRSRIMVIKNNSYLAVKHSIGSNKWSLPGGGVKRGEDYKAAAIRELSEELGIVIQPNDVHELVGLTTYNEGGHMLRYVIFVAKIAGEVTFSHNHEISEVGWPSVHEQNTSNHVNLAMQRATSRGYLLK